VLEALLRTIFALPTSPMAQGQTAISKSLV
jgi:hypothetical protein